MRRLIPAALLLLAACGGADEAALPADEDLAPVETATPAPSPSASTALAIPAALQGRWGMVPADCEPGRADAKGLLVVSGNKLEFYESVGTLGAVSDSGPTRIRALFAFTGEGMEWTRDMLLETADGGSSLVRREYGADAAPDPFRYNKCR